MKIMRQIRMFGKVGSNPYRSDNVKYFRKKCKKVEKNGLQTMSTVV